MADLDIDAIKQRCEAATEGPWEAGRCGGSVVRHGLAIGTSITGETLEWYGGIPVCESASPEDREFIAHARTDIPALVSEVERLREEVQSCRKVIVCLWHDYCQESGASLSPEVEAIWNRVVGNAESEVPNADE